jgi:hypothetical protein
MVKEKIYIYTLSDSSGVRYVGQTKKLKNRFYRHIFDGKNFGGKNKRCSWIKSLLNKNEKPIMEIIDEVDVDEWIFWERYWISQFKTWGFNLVNDTDGGEGQYGRIFSNETRIKISLSKKGKIPKNINILKKCNIKEPVVQYDLDGNRINEYESSNYVKEVLGVKNVFLVITKKRCSANGYIWRFKSDKLTDSEILEIKNKHLKLRKKPILQKSKTGEILKEWGSVREVKKIYPNIMSVLSGNRKSAGGYFWEYKNNEFRGF